jgi:transcriptional regulator with XRE-family HTH domain
MTIGAKIKKLREDQNLSQREVAEHINITQASYHKLESDKVRAKVDTLEKLAKFFGVSFEEIRGGENHSIKIEHNQNNTNQKVSGLMINFSDEDIINILKKQIADKEEIIRLKDEKIALLERALGNNHKV